MKVIELNIGDIVTSDTPAVISTIVGSCIAVAVWDSETCIGGMTHYLLPSPHDEKEDESQSYGSVAIPRLVQRILSHGAARHAIQAKVFGGGSLYVDREGGRIANQNIAIALSILKEMNIPVVNLDVGGVDGRKVLFYTDNGKALVKKLGCPHYAFE